MLYTVTVSFGVNNEYEFKFLDTELAGLPKDQARAWLHQEFEALECTPRNPVGKILLLDVILDVAKYGGESRFVEGGDWARKFVHCVGAALGRDTVRIDVPNLVVG